MCRRGECIHRCIDCGAYSNACDWTEKNGMAEEFYRNHGQGRCVNIRPPDRPVKMPPDLREIAQRINEGENYFLNEPDQLKLFVPDADFGRLHRMGDPGVAKMFYNCPAVGYQLQMDGYKIVLSPWRYQKDGSPRHHLDRSEDTDTVKYNVYMVYDVGRCL